MKDLILKDVMAVLPDIEQPKNISIKINCDSGLISEIAESIIDHQADVNSSFENCFAFPGFIDPHVHFRTPGENTAEDWSHGSRAALFAGVSTVLDMPNTKPSTIDAVSFEEKKKLIAQSSLVNYGLHIGLTQSNLASILDIEEAKSIKVYMASTTGSLLVEDLHTIENKNLDQKKLMSKIFLFHAENEKVIQENLKAISEIKTPEQHSAVRSEESAIIASREVIQLQKKLGLNFHISHVSTAIEVEEILQTALSYEVCPHHIFCSVDDYKQYGFLLKCNPPLRDKETADKLLQYLYDEKITIIATDHAPHSLSDKKRISPLPPSGVPSLEVGTHFILHEFMQNKITANYTRDILSSNAANRFSIKKRGQLKVGNFADIALVKKHTWKMQQSDIHSKCHWSPFVGKQFSAKVVATIVNGALYDTSSLKDIKEKRQVYVV